MPIFKIKIAKDGGVVIPLEYLQQLGLQPGNKVIMQLKDSEIIIFTPDRAIERAQAWVRSFIPEGHSLVDELIAERRKESLRE
ncbi:MAG: AbrB/MazE/SpoVT family DNA-binding domain-containing protein [Hormoscilla sp. SP5CHS1]|nr:AbrB/MazE/SpoVT family DNA-binding domain-containing protein [Hormoscilla sp. SP12CHS1]MBC6454734.1 AbrB/MazE/SpoVT family DNA-binding domain-containing protein [Hormoscilla sp. SP5CHS1]MBC6472631.1 AbrB/MazE/SpoVT family DNA-binding domain-containing protein [Hormoscilla sp. GM102CHS1]